MYCVVFVRFFWLAYVFPGDLSGSLPQENLDTLVEEEILTPVLQNLKKQTGRKNRHKTKQKTKQNTQQSRLKQGITRDEQNRAEQTNSSAEQDRAVEKARKSRTKQSAAETKSTKTEQLRTKGTRCHVQLNTVVRMQYILRSIRRLLISATTAPRTRNSIMRSTYILTRLTPDQKSFWKL